MRILLVSQMYPGPDDPDLGVFVRNLERELLARGHATERAVVDTRGGGHRRHLALARDTFAAARRFKPDVVYAHFLVPAGLLGALASRAPLVVTAHGQDVQNAGAIPCVGHATRHVVRRAATVVAVSGWLRDRLLEEVPEAAEKIEVVDCGVDLERFAPRNREDARAAVGFEARGTAFLCLGALSERKNVLRLARAFKSLGEGTLTFVDGDSHKTVPEYFRTNAGQAFDLITVDGDHSVGGAIADLQNVKEHVRIGGAIVFDDISNPSHPGLLGAWRKVIGTDPRFGCFEYNELGFGIAFGIRKRW